MGRILGESAFARALSVGENLKNTLLVFYMRSIMVDKSASRT
jgi:hypothetical protein